MFETLLKYPETLAHWIIILPFMSFAFIVLKLTINKSPRPALKKAESQLTEEQLKALGPSFTNYIPYILLLVAVLVISAAIRTGFGIDLFGTNLPYLIIFGIPIAIIVLFPVNSRAWIQKAAPYISVGAMAIGAIIVIAVFIDQYRHRREGA